ncbi:sugar transferase [Flavobacterium ardleyense]|uniref:sugar transferase n=1 Tax=Flavobacterium ardleyense TaxID=2038737 RepID=UPI00298BFB28|nr:sugar transferase [Flavobacterium ardleyense]
MYRNYIKRLLDFTISLSALVLLLPVFIVLIIVLYYSNEKAGIFFQQPRPGKNGKVFKVLKFKTMNDRKDATGQLLPSFERITKFGRIMRNSSLDEIPQLINVLKGDMSLIGPRPLLVHYLPLYNEAQLRRHNMRPGITGWAQVNGRNAISWTKKFELDVWYVDNASFILDLKILYMTFQKVVRGADINASSDATMPSFDGTN